MGFFTYFLARPGADRVSEPGATCDPGDGWRAMPRTIGWTLARPIGAPIPGADDIAEGPDGALYVSGRQAGAASVPATGYLDALGLRQLRRRWPAGLHFIPMAGCWSASPAAASPRSIARGQQTWLNQAGDQPLQVPRPASRRAGRQHLHDRRQQPALSRRIGCAISWRRTISAG